MKNTKEKKFYFEILNILACISVIALHCNGLAHQFENTAAWRQALFVEVIAYWAVPVFFMMSGAKLLNYREKYTTAEFFKRRLIKVVVPWLLWCGIWIVMKVFIVRSVTFDSVGDVIRFFYDGIIMNQLDSTYWFFPALIALYLTMPVISLLTKYRKILWYFTGITFLTYSVMPIVCELLGVNYNGSFCFPLGNGYVLYMLLGYLLATENTENRKLRVCIYLLGIFSICLRYGATYYLSIRDDTLNQTFFSYTYFTAVFLSAAVFVFFKHINYKWLQEGRIKKLIIHISSCSFGIYLSHQLIMFVIIGVFDINLNGIVWRTAGVLFVYFTALLLTTILKRIKIFNKWLVP